jgi:hypothetical protein
MGLLPTSEQLFIELTYDTLHSASYVRPFSLSDLEKHKGFRSVYLYGVEAYKKICETGAVRNLNKFPVYSDTLFIDFDDGDKSIETLKTILDKSGIAWEMYFSGRKGYHFHIPIEPMWGVHVPYSQKQFVRGLGLDTADTSIYKHTGLFRTPGTYHKVTGEKKALVDSSKGNVLRVPYIEPEDTFEVVQGTVASLTAALNTANHIILDEPGAGGRHNSLLAVAKHLIQAGAQKETILDICSLVHNSWEEQYENPQEEIESIVERAAHWQSVGD